jgi:hypothetical protein
MKFAFLLYVSRSGSTFLARQLATHSPNLLVLPETRLFGWLVMLGDAGLSALTPSELFDLINKDFQFENLGIDKAKLSEVVKRNHRKVGPLIEDLVNLYSRNGCAADFVLVQIGTPKYCEKLLSIFPDAKFLNIYRDVRGTVNSMVNAHRPYFPGELMGAGDVVFAAKQWRSFMKRIDALKTRLPIYEICYEQFCIEIEKDLTEITAAIGCRFQKTAESSNAFPIGQREQEIHKLVFGPAKRARLDAWKTELSLYQGLAIEIVAKDLLESRGYRLWFSNKCPIYFRVLCFIWMYCKFVVKCSTFYYRRVAYYRQNRILIKYKFWDLFLRKCKYGRIATDKTQLGSQQRRDH